MRTRRARAGFGALVITALVGAACGGDDGGDSAAEGGTEATVAAQLQSDIGQALATTTSQPAEEFTSMEQWEQRWADERAAIVERAEAEGWGKSADGTTVTGPEGYTIDLTKCGAGWSDTEGLTDDTIKIGFTGPLSGTLADVGNYMRLLEAFAAYENEQGGFTDSEGKTRRLQVEIRDDGYDPTRTIPLVDELIDAQKVFAVGTIGTPNQVKVFDKLNERCVPHPAISGHSSVGDPVGHPWTTSSSISYTSEAVIIGQFTEAKLDTEFGGKATVAVLLFSNDFGAAFDSGFEAFLASSARAADIEYVTEIVEPSAPTIKDAMTTLASKEPDVFVAAVAGAACTQAVTESAENGMKEAVPYKILDSACKASGVKPLELAGQADGWYAVGGGYRDITSAAADTDPWMIHAREMLAASGLDYKASTSFNAGSFYMWPWMQALHIAGELPGGLTRSNFNLAFRGMEMTHPHLYPGVKFNMNGMEDAFFVEGSDITVWSEANKVWEVITVLDVSGKTPLCTWDFSAAKCS
ncbi:MAG: ABC transporter substrate-binding protein [Acidimicrobiia bacterium]